MARSKMAPAPSRGRRRKQEWFILQAKWNLGLSCSETPLSERFLKCVPKPEFEHNLNCQNKMLDFSNVAENTCIYRLVIPHVEKSVMKRFLITYLAAVVWLTAL